MIVARPALERRITASLEAGRIPVVLGACGTGRTSLLRRLADLSGPDRAQYLDLAACATTPERCLAAVRDVCPLARSVPDLPVTSPRQAFDGLMRILDESATADAGPVTFFIDEALDVRTFENFPGLRQVQRETMTRLSASANRFVLASRFTTRAHRLLRDSPARFEVVHLSPLDREDIRAAADGLGDAPADIASHAATIQALTAGRAGYAASLLDALAGMAPTADPVVALASLLTPDGRLTARCRESYEMRLHRARGYGALKAIVGILAEQEPLTLTDIARRLHRTPGSTKDYLSWLEDVDLVSVTRKRYTVEDPLVRLYVRLYGRPIPPEDADVVREVRAFARARLEQATDPAPVVPAAPALATAPRPAEAARSGIIEID